MGIHGYFLMVPVPTSTGTGFRRVRVRVDPKLPMGYLWRALVWSSGANLFLAIRTIYIAEPDPITLFRGLYHAPQIPAGFWSFQRNPVESRGIKNGRGASQHCHSGGHIFQSNKAIPELRLECSPELTGTECDWNAITGIELSMWELAVYVKDVHHHAAATTAVTRSHQTPHCVFVWETE